MKSVVEIGGRLREERERLGLTQEALARNVGVAKLTQLNYESARSHPSAAYLAHFAKMGADVLYVITGERVSSQLDLDPIQKVVLASLALCSPQRQMEAVQVLAMLAAGQSPNPSSINDANPAGRSAWCESFKRMNT